MASPNDAPMNDGNVDVHEPFAVEDNIRQLNEIDQNIAQLMNHTATVLNAVTIASSSTTSEGPKPQTDPAAQKEALHTATDSFLDALHSVDVKMKRQIMALEEAGIVNLSNAPKQEPGSAAGKASLKPDGMGSVGNLDVGWLNSRGSKVERDMEAELWSKTREFLESEGDKLKMG